MQELTSEAGGLLAARRPDILRSLESRLRDTGNSLGQDPAVLPECLARADSVLARTESDLVGPASPEPAGLPPGGAGVLMDVVLGELLRVVVDRPDRVRELSAVLTALHRNLTSSDSTAGDDYDMFILRSADEARRRERRQIAGAIHDELGHELSIAMHQLELGELVGASDPDAVLRRVATARSHLAAAMDITRRLITEFTEAKAGVDLAKEIVSFADAAGELRTVVHARVTGSQLLVPPQHRHELFLIAREALLNVFAHAAAAKAVVLVDISSAEITAEITDDGAGFDAGAVRGRGGFGLVSMRERAASLGGTVEVTSSAAGTTVAVRLPLP